MIHLELPGAGAKRMCFSQDGFAAFWKTFKAAVDKPEAAVATFKFPVKDFDGKEAARERCADPDLRTRRLHPAVVEVEPIVAGQAGRRDLAVGPHQPRNAGLRTAELRRDRDQLGTRAAAPCFDHRQRRAIRGLRCADH